MIFSPLLLPFLFIMTTTYCEETYYIGENSKEGALGTKEDPFSSMDEAFKSSISNNITIFFLSSEKCYKISGNYSNFITFMKMR